MWNYTLSRDKLTLAGSGIINPNVAQNLSSKRYRLGQQGTDEHFQGRKRIEHTVRS